jgi:hypothetical protein
MSAPRAHTFRIDAQSAASRLVKISLHRQPLHARQHRGNHRKGRPSKRILCRHALTSLRATQVTNFEIFLFRGLKNQDPTFGPGNRSLYGRTEHEETYIFKFSFSQKWDRNLYLSAHQKLSFHSRGSVIRTDSEKKIRQLRLLSRDLYAQILLLTIHKSLQLWTRTSYWGMQKSWTRRGGGFVPVRTVTS